MMITSISEQLQKCKLWPNSTLDLAFKGGYLTREMILDKVNKLEGCDDLTGNEWTFLHSLKHELEITSGRWLGN